MNKNLNILLEGNKRFVEDKLIHPNIDQKTRDSVYEKQKPFVVIVACSDSRMPVETIFDIGIGDAFVVRTAGHVLSDISIASIEYAVEHLDTKLILVLGHYNCGAVKAALNDNNTELTPSLKTMVDKIKPAVEKAKKETSDNKELFELSVKYNVEETINKIKESEPILKNLIKNNEVEIVGATYNIKTGKVELI